MLASLEEFRMYRITVLATFTSEFGLTNPTAESSSTDFETLSAGKFAILVSEHPMWVHISYNTAPTMGPRDVIATPASKTVQVTWNTIESVSIVMASSLIMRCNYEKTTVGTWLPVVW